MSSRFKVPFENLSFSTWPMTFSFAYCRAVSINLYPLSRADSTARRISFSSKTWKHPKTCMNCFILFCFGLMWLWCPFTGAHFIHSPIGCRGCVVGIGLIVRTATLNTRCETYADICNDWTGLHWPSRLKHMSINAMIVHPLKSYHNTVLILGLHPANERRRYFVAMSLIGWVQT